MARKPMPDELAALQRLLAAAGSKTKLQQWVKELPSRKAGRPSYPDSEALLMYLELVCRIYQHVGVKRNTTLKMLVYGMQGRIGRTREAAVRRLAARLRDPEFAATGFTEDKLKALTKAFPFLAGLKRTYDRQQHEPAKARSTETEFFRERIRRVRQRDTQSTGRS